MPNKAGTVRTECNQCGKVFRVPYTKGMSGVPCPKCHSTNTGMIIALP
jgi:Zn finger protein HypA/HybF involved in hydrogenase expression